MPNIYFGLFKMFHFHLLIYRIIIEFDYYNLKFNINLYNINIYNNYIQHIQS
jgi:hypothetical protein